MLARHGYGVLLFDRRGEGRSEGQPNSWGWGGERDVKGAIAFLQTAAASSASAASASPSAARCCWRPPPRRANWTPSSPTARAHARWRGEPGRRVRADRARHARPRRRRRARPRPAAGPRRPRRAHPRSPTLLIAAPNSPNGEQLNREYARGSRRAAVGDPGGRAHRRDQGPPGRVRAPRRRLLRRSAPALNAKAPAAQRAAGARTKRVLRRSGRSRRSGPWGRSRPQRRPSRPRRGSGSPSC